MKCRHCEPALNTDRLTEEDRRALDDFRSNDTDLIGAWDYFRDHPYLTAHLVKLALLHVTLVGGYCHRCGRSWSQRGVSNCGFCGALNLDWRPRTGPDRDPLP